MKRSPSTVDRALEEYRRWYFQAPGSPEFQKSKQELEKLNVPLRQRNAALWQGPPTEQT